MRRRRRSAARRVGTAAVCIGLLGATAGCGARWDEDQRGAVLARADGSGSAAAGPASRSGAANRSGAPVGDPLAATAAGPATDGALDPGAGAPGGSGTGGGDAATQAPGTLPCSAPSDAPGVTEAEITLGTISSVSGPVPGLGASSLAAVQAYAAFRNSTGGVCGRQLAVRSADDGTDSGRHRALTTELSSQVLGLAGGVGAGDVGSKDIVEERQIPVVLTPISAQFAEASTVFDIDPPYPDVHAVTSKYRYLHDQGVRRAALVYIAADQTRHEAVDKHRPLIEAAGIEVVHQQEVPLSTLSFDSAARAVANSGADYMLFISDAGQSASMARSMADTGYELKYQEYLIAYGSNFIELAGSAAEGVTSWIRSLPNEDAGAVAEQNAFLEWMDRTAPGTVVDTFAADAWAAAKAFVDALASLPGPITREAVVAQLRATTGYDAGGLIGRIELGPKLTNGCLIAMIVENGAWRRLTPAEGFLC